jgi:response regulator of citrate/malate metabolism
VKSDDAGVTKRTTSVLVVDDDFMVADVHRRLIEREHGYTVVAMAHSASEAKRCVDEYNPELILLDVYLPDGSGIEFLTELRRLGSRCHVIVVTAARDADTVQAALRLGALHYLIKPFDTDALRSALRRFRKFKEAATALGSPRLVSQMDIDTAFDAFRSPLSTPPKGLSLVTLNLVLSALSAKDPQSANEVAAVTGLSRASARRYLEHLAETGNIDLTLRYGTAGRPEHQYLLRT